MNDWLDLDLIIFWVVWFLICVAIGYWSPWIDKE
jgi:TM2 domain-containing membrane protein YozV